MKQKRGKTINTTFTLRCKIIVLESFQIWKFNLSDSFQVFPITLPKCCALVRHNTFQIFWWLDKMIRFVGPAAIREVDDGKHKLLVD